MKILNPVMMIRMFSNNSLSGLDEPDNGFKNQAFLKAFAGNGMGFYLMKPIRTKSENARND